MLVVTIETAGGWNGHGNQVQSKLRWTRIVESVEIRKCCKIGDKRQLRQIN